MMIADDKGRGDGGQREGVGISATPSSGEKGRK